MEKELLKSLIEDLERFRDEMLKFEKDRNTNSFGNALDNIDHSPERLTKLINNYKEKIRSEH